MTTTKEIMESRSIARKAGKDLPKLPEPKSVTLVPVSIGMYSAKIDNLLGQKAFSIEQALSVSDQSGSNN